MSDCGVPLLGALAGLVTAIGAAVVAWSKVLEANTAREKMRLEHEARDRAIVGRLKLWPRSTGGPMIGRVLAPMTATDVLNGVAREGGWVSQKSTNELPLR